MKSGGQVYLTKIRSQVALGVPTAVGVSGHGLLEMDEGAFTYASQDQFLTISNSAAVTSLVTTKGSGAGTTITESVAAMEGLVSIEKLA